MIRAALTCLLLLPGAVQAQGLSLEELQAQIDTDTAEIEGFRALLSDPNPSRAIAAMRAMMASGDVVLENLALEAGLSSAHGPMRKTALETYLDTGPTLQIAATLQDGDNTDVSAFQSWMSSYGTLSGERTGAITLVIGKKLDEQNCYSTTGTCVTWLTADGISFTVAQGLIGTVRLGDGGVLVGNIGGKRIGGPVDLRADLLGLEPVQ